MNKKITIRLNSKIVNRVELIAKEEKRTKESVYRELLELALINYMKGEFGIYD